MINISDMQTDFFLDGLCYRQWTVQCPVLDFLANFMLLLCFTIQMKLYSAIHKEGRKDRGYFIQIILLKEV